MVPLDAAIDRSFPLIEATTVRNYLQYGVEFLPSEGLPPDKIPGQEERVREVLSLQTQRLASCRSAVHEDDELQRLQPTQFCAREVACVCHDGMSNAFFFRVLKADVCLV